HRGPQLKVEVALDALLGDRLGDALGVASLELPGQQVAQPALQQGGDAPHEEEPHPPAGGPDPAARALAHGALEHTRERGTPPVEAVVDQVLEVLAHANLTHELVLVAVHARELAHMGEDVLEPVGQLEGIHVVQPVLHVAVHHQLCQPQDLPAQVEGVAEAGLFPLLGHV
ncbi:unnamed protein product, partial [Ixodes persulcatus]